jgi:hypothetical protein
MKIVDTIKKSQHQVTGLIYLVCLVIAVVTVLNVFAFVTATDDAAEKVQAAKEKYKLDDKAVKEYQKKYVTAADKLKKKNHLTPKPSKPKPPTCTAVIGHKALINGKLYAVGQSVLGAKITDINPTGATILWEGKPMHLAAFGKVTSISPPKPSDKKKSRHRVEKRPDKKSKDAGGMVGPRGKRRGGQGRERGGRGGLMKLTPEERQKMKEKYMKMSAEEQEKYREEMKNKLG